MPCSNGLMSRSRWFFPGYKRPLCCLTFFKRYTFVFEGIFPWEMTTMSRNIQEQTHPDRHTHARTKSYHTLNDRQSVKTCVRLICLGIKTGRQLRNLRQQSIPQTICFHHLYEPNDYLQPAVSTERMNKFMRVLWTAWGARINLHVFHAQIWGYWFTDENHHWSNYKWEHRLYYLVFVSLLFIRFYTVFWERNLDYTKIKNTSLSCAAFLSISVSLAVSVD